VAPSSFPRLAPPLAVLLGWMALLAVGMYFLGMYFLAQGGGEELPPRGNPAELKSALFFGGLYALVPLGVAAAKDWMGNTGLYGVAILSYMYPMRRSHLGGFLGRPLMRVRTLCLAVWK